MFEIEHHLIEYKGGTIIVRLAYLNSQLLDASYLNIIKSTASTDINIINSKPPSQA